MEKILNKLHNDITHYIYTEMAMWDDLSQNDKYKKDRELAKEKWSLLNETLSELKKIIDQY